MRSKRREPELEEGAAGLALPDRRRSLPRGGQALHEVKSVGAYSGRRSGPLGAGSYAQRATVGVRGGQIFHLAINCAGDSES